VFEKSWPNQPVEVWMRRDEKHIQRLFNPYTGADVGDALQPGFRALLWLVDLHDNLLGGRKGRLINGVGGVFTTLLCITGIVIWWPGIDKWRRSLVVDFK